MKSRVVGLFLVIMGMAGLVIFLIFHYSLNFGNFNQMYRAPTVGIKNTIFEIEIADKIASQVQGLSGRESMAKNKGMIFVFDQPKKQGFWMKDMKFPIDIVWIRDNKIVGFSENLHPEPQKNTTDLLLYYPQETVNEVLEINAGLVKQNNFQIGDEVKFRRWKMFVIFRHSSMVKVSARLWGAISAEINFF